MKKTRRASLRPLAEQVPTLSIVMAVYNERATAAASIEQVLKLDLPRMAIQLIVVESNSSDGSREIVERYVDDPRVTLVLQDEARGKGNAVREGLRHVAGQIVLIQDADLEYSVDDYPALLAPILDGRCNFTLGCRHVRGQPMRVMAGKRTTAAVVNAAHWVFTSIFNITYGTKLRDPFTMYKVFRTDCIAGVEFTADRFDFDWELVAKLVRLGHPPREIPVSYDARAFGEGKKVRFFRDPPTWVWACLRYRLCSLPQPQVTPSTGPARDECHLAEPDPYGTVSQRPQQTVSGRSSL